MDGMRLKVVEKASGLRSGGVIPFLAAGTEIEINKFASQTQRPRTVTN